jgi:hypothetical protein
VVGAWTVLIVGDERVFLVLILFATLTGLKHKTNDFRTRRNGVMSERYFT